MTIAVEAMQVAEKCFVMMTISLVELFHSLLSVSVSVFLPFSLSVCLFLHLCVSYNIQLSFPLR